MDIDLMSLEEDGRHITIRAEPRRGLMLYYYDELTNDFFGKKLRD